MKRLLSAVCALTLVCTAFAACGKDKDDSKDGGSNKAASGPSLKEGQHYYDYLKEAGEAKNLKLGIKAEQQGMTITMLIEEDGDNIHTYADMVFIKMDTYTIDGTTYTIDTDAKTYYTSTSEEVDEGALDVVAQDGIEFVSLEKKDGLNAETYKMTDDESYTVVYYYDDSLILKKMDITQGDETVPVEVTDFQIGGVKVELPDLSGYTEEDPTADWDFDLDEEDWEFEDEDEDVSVEE
ncbi:MAG: hypothetical protein IJ737_07495 [Ruminococcus sp.]|nr:hypothetical protein [Ruminococcus sp.]